LTLAGVVKEDLACPGSSLPEKRKRKLQAASFKQRLTMVQGSCRMVILTNTGEINDKKYRRRCKLRKFKKNS